MNWKMMLSESWNGEKMGRVADKWFLSQTWQPNRYLSVGMSMTREKEYLAEEGEPVSQSRKQRPLMLVVG
jgi:hypothetical protein